MDCQTISWPKMKTELRSTVRSVKNTFSLCQQIVCPQQQWTVDARHRETQESAGKDLTRSVGNIDTKLCEEGRGTEEYGMVKGR